MASLLICAQKQEGVRQTNATAAKENMDMRCSWGQNFRPLPLGSQAFSQAW
jgi:hypothetical protein